MTLPSPFNSIQNAAGIEKSIISEKSSQVETESSLDNALKVSELGSSVQETINEENTKSIASSNKLNFINNSTSNKFSAAPTSNQQNAFGQNVNNSMPNQSQNQDIAMSPPNRNFQKTTPGSYSNSGGFTRGRGSTNFGGGGYNNMGDRSYGQPRSFSRGGYSNAYQSYPRPYEKLLGL